jgi:hypothetical protein
MVDVGSCFSCCHKKKTQVDTSNLTEEEKKLYEKYGRLPKKGPLLPGQRGKVREGGLLGELLVFCLFFWFGGAKDAPLPLSTIF